MSGGRAMGGGDGLSGQGTPMKKGSGSVSNDSELETLKKKADDINKELEGIITHINKLETSD